MEYGVVGRGSGLARCLEENWESSRVKTVHVTIGDHARIVAFETAGTRHDLWTFFIIN